MYEVRITVLKRMANPDLIDAHMGEPARTERLADPYCGCLSEGQTFVLPNPADMPSDFCPWAWSDIHKEILAVAAGGDFAPWLREPGTTLACCTDAFRPVAFKIERGRAIDSEGRQPDEASR